jgi:predicted Zn-dependent peptidase
MNQYFGTIPQGPADTNRAALKRALRPGEIRTATVTDPMLTYSMVTLAFPSIPHRQSKTRAALDLVLNHLTGSPQAVLNLALQHRSPLANNIQAWNTSGKETGKFTILAEVTPGKEQATANALMSELRALQRTPISQQHLDQLKAKACFDFRKNLNEAQFSAMDMGNALFSNTLDDYINYERLINSLTPEDLQQTIQTVLNPTSYVLVYGVPEPKTNKQVSGDRPPAFQGWSPYHTTSLACAGAQRQGHRGG